MERGSTLTIASSEPFWRHFSVFYLSFYMPGILPTCRGCTVTLGNACPVLEIILVPGVKYPEIRVADL